MQVQENSPEEAVGKAPQMPMDVRPQEPRASVRESQGGMRSSWWVCFSDYRLALRLAVPAAPVLMVIAMVFNYFGAIDPRFLVLEVVAGIAIAVMWLVARRVTSSPKHVMVRWFALSLLCIAIAIPWWDLMLRYEGDWRLLPASLALMLALAPLSLWMPWFLVGVSVLAAIPFIGGYQQVQWLVPGVTMLLLLAAGAMVAVLTSLRRRLERRNVKLSRTLAKVSDDMADQTQRLRYENDQRLRAERELQKLREVADSASHAKTEFLATMSHEIRTPLNGILPILEMLDGTRLDEDQRRYVTTAFSSSRHLLRIIDDILDFAKAESGKLQLESLEIDLHEMIQAVMELMQGSADNKGLALQLELSSDVPRRLRCDPIRVRQILINLISNAIKFTQAGSVRLSVAPRRSSRKEVELLFEVIDTGVGMSRDTARKLFQSFTQADASTTRKHGGTGLGLAICKRLVNLMGGSIGVRSQPGIGSTFWFVLPMRKSQADVPAARQDLHGVRILYCIGDDECAANLNTWLQQWGVRPDFAGPDEVYDKLHDSAMLGKSWAFELLLMDTWGIEQDMLRLLRQIRSDPLLKRRLRIVLAGRSEPLLERLHMQFNAHVINGALRQAPLQTTLNRLLDVEVGSGDSGTWTKADHLVDLNLQREMSLADITPVEDSGISDAASLGRVLLVEDNPVNLGVVKRLLESMGLQTLVAQNGREALEQLRQGDIDLVFMDCQMPVMDGYQATQAWREREQGGDRRMPIVAMTANAMAGDRERCLESGMDDYLAKPVSKVQVQAMLARWLPQGFDPDSQPLEPPPQQSDPDSILDRGVLAELREVMDEAYGELLETYLNNAPKLVEQLEQAAMDRDASSLQIPAHSLKSSSANIGAMKLSKLSADIETSVRRGEYDEALALHAGLEDLYLRTREALKQELIDAGA